MGDTSPWIPRKLQDGGRIRALKAGETLFLAGNRTTGIYEIVSGRVRLVRTGPSGRETTLYTAGAGEIIAEASLFSSVYHCDAIATTDATVRLYPKAALLAAFERNPQAANQFSAMLARQIMTLRTRLERNTLRSARERVLHYLSLNAGADGRTTTIQGSLKDFARELGLSHEALYRALAALEKSKTIRRTGTSILLTGRPDTI